MINKLEKFVHENCLDILLPNGDVVDSVIKFIRNTRGIKTNVFSATVFYSDGIGPQFYTIDNIEANTIAEAKSYAESIANKNIGKDKWKEIKVRPKL